MLRIPACLALLACVFAANAQTTATPATAPTPPATPALPAAIDRSAPPRALSTPTPAMPRKDVEAGHSGTVTLALRIGADGKVAEAGVATSSGWPTIDASAVKTARNWTFTPARNAAGEAIESRVQVPISFDAGPAEAPAAASANSKPATPPTEGDYAEAFRSGTQLTCAQFVEVVDRDQLTGKTVSDAVPQYKMLWGLIIAVQLPNRPADELIAFMKRRDELFDTTLARCRATPDEQLRKAFGAGVEALLAR